VIYLAEKRIVIEKRIVTGKRIIKKIVGQFYGSGCRGKRAGVLMPNAQNNEQHFHQLLGKTPSPAKLLGLPTSTFAFLAFAVVVLIVNGALAYRSVIKLVENDYWVSHTYQVIGGLEQLLSLLKDAETGTRGYILAGANKYLDPYNAAVAQLSAQIARVKQLTSDNPRQQQRFPELTQRIDRRIALLQQGISLRQQGVAGPQQQEELQDAGKQEMDGIRALVSSMRNEEFRLLAERRIDSARARRYTEISFILVSVLAILFLAITAWLLQGERRLRAKAAEETERFRAMYEHAAVGIKQVALDGSLLMVNAAFCSMLGYSESELLGKKLDDITYPEDRGREAALLRELTHGESEYYRMEKRCFHRNGAMVWVVVTNSLVKDVAGQPLYGISIAEDITEHKHAEAVLREQAALIDIAHDAIMVREVDGTILSWNHGAEEMYGYAKAQAVGKVSHELLQTEFPQPLAEIEVKVKHAERWEGELTHTTQEGRRIVVASRWVRLPGATGGQPSRVMEINNDITERKHAENQLVELNRELEDRIRRRTIELEAMNKEAAAFSYSVSHDLRAPLRTLDGFSQAILEDYAKRLDDKGRHYLERMRAAAQRMGQLIDALLQLSRLTRSEMEIKPVDLSGIAQSVVEDLRNSDRARSVDVKIAPGLNTRGDPRLLQIALHNLLSNAWKFTSRREHATIEMGRADGQSGKTFFIRDNGVGFDMQYAGQLFAAFQRLHSEAEFSGTGIGLATVQRVVLRHHGRIWVEASEGEGATFYFELCA
jgi:PAS domain S-box-containing protein